MLGKKKKNKKMEEIKGKVETIIGTGTAMDGDINTKGSLRIEGNIKGNIKTEGDIFIGKSGEVNTTIEARNIVIAGTVKGNIIAEEKVEILPSGNLNGDINAKILKIEEGAIFNGASKIISVEEKKAIINSKDNSSQKSENNRKN